MEGYEVKDVASSGDRACGFTIQADSKDEMARKHKEAVCNIKVIDAAGRDIMRRDLMPDLHC